MPHTLPTRLGWAELDHWGDSATGARARLPEEGGVRTPQEHSLMPYNLTEISCQEAEIVTCHRPGLPATPDKGCLEKTLGPQF